MKDNIQLSPQVQQALDQIDRLVAGLGPHADLDSFRQIYDRMDAMGGIPEILAQVEDRFIRGEGGMIPIRVYRPSLQIDLPVLIYIHGGWFSIGSLNSHDTLARALARASNCVVISIAYRLAPEQPFPAGLDDCYAVTKWVSDHPEEFGVNPDRLAVAGDSAGGALATVIARKAMEDKGPRILFQGLFCPVTDASLNTGSWKKFSEGPVLNLKGAEQSWSDYIPENSDALSPDVSPLLAQNLNGMPPALIITSEFDPLRDEAINYALALKRAGVTVKHSDYEGMIHGFYQMAGIVDEGKNAIQEMALSLIKYFNLS